MPSVPEWRLLEAGTSNRRGDWRSYDPIASEYASVAAPAYFARPAADLVALLQLPPGASVLDVGAGSGAVLLNAAIAVGESGWIAGVDLSLSMLLVARKKGLDAGFAVAALPDLPFGQRVFDAVTASFVLSHIQDSRKALGEMARVLKPRGKIGVTSWKSSPASPAAGQLWQEIAHGFVSEEVLQREMDRALPGEERLSQAEALRASLGEAGLVRTSAEQRSYRIELRTETYARSRLLSLSSRFMMARLEAGRWKEFEKRATDLLLERFGERLAFDVSVNFAIGTRP